MSAQISQKTFQSEWKLVMRPNIRPAASNNAQRSAKYVQNIFKNQNNQDIRPFCTTFERNDNS